LKVSNSECSRKPNPHKLASTVLLTADLEFCAQMTDKQENEQSTPENQIPREESSSPGALSIPDVDLPLPDPEAFSDFMKEIFAVVAEDIRR
jgi:hypothetical protein